MTNIEHDWHSLGVAIEKLPDEPSEAYQAFLAYAWLQYGERTYTGAAQRANMAPQTVSRYAQEFDWANRVSAVDAARWLKEFRDREALTEDDNRRYVEANRDAKDKLLNISQKMVEVAAKLIDSALISDEVIEGDMIQGADGIMYPTSTIINMKAKISDIPRLVDTAAKTMRMINDLPTEAVERNAEFLTQDYSNLSEEEIIALRNQNRLEMLRLGAIEKLESVN